VESLKVTLFRQADIAKRDFKYLFSSLFRMLDYGVQGNLTATDIRIFVQRHLPALMPYPDRMYQLLIQIYAGAAAMSFSFPADSDGNMTFADFMYLVWPQQKFRKATEEILFAEGTPAYSDEGQVSEETLCLVAEILANYLQFYMEREQLLIALSSTHLSFAELFSRICSSSSGLSCSASLYSQNESHRVHSAHLRSFNSNQLFSYLLHLPVIFSTFDTDLILASLVFKKDRTEVSFDEFRALFGAKR
jgi:hypothetical protein